MNVDKKSQLTEKQLTILDSEMQKHRKNPVVAYLLCIFLGSLGVHQFYLGNVKRGLLYLIMGILGWMSMFAGGASFLLGGGGGFGVILGWLLITVLGFFLLYDLFTMSRQIRDAEEREESKIIEQLQSM